MSGIADPSRKTKRKNGIEGKRIREGETIVWGARTLRGADQVADEYKYVPVRRLALYIEESLYRGTQWVVFEPNDESLWAQIRLNVGAFMHGLFRQDAFQGQTPQDAYFVKCDKETTPQDQVNLGVVNIAVGFAPLKPAEFVIIRLQVRSKHDVYKFSNTTSYFSSSLTEPMDQGNCYPGLRSRGSLQPGL